MNRNRILLLVFGILLLVFLWNYFFSSNESRNFKETLVEVDTTQITRITLTPRESNGDSFDITKTGSTWEVSDATVKDEADIGVVRGMLSSVVKITPKRLVAKSEKKWAQYEVNDSLGSRVKVYNGDESVADFIVGKFNFQQNTRSMSTFVRLAEEEEVYSVEGFLSSTFNQSFSNLRDKTFLKFNTDDLTSVRFQYPADSSFTLNKIGDTWIVNEGVVDSTAVQTFFNSVQSVTPREFNDTFSASGSVASYQVAFEGNNMNTVTIKGFGSPENLILHSSLNENAYFKNNATPVFEKLFISLESLNTTIAEYP